MAHSASAPKRLVRLGRQLDRVLVAEDPQHLVDEIEQPGCFLRRLLRRAEDVCVILREPADAQQAVQHPAPFVAIQRSELRVPQRQIPIRSGTRLINGDVARAVHWLGTVARAFDIHGAEHVLTKVLQVAGDLEQLLVDDVRRVHQLIAATQNQVTFEGLDLVAHRRAAGVPENQPRSDARVSREQVELSAERAMIAALGFLEAVDVRVDIRLRPPRRRVDPLEHRPTLVAAPVRPGGVEELEVLQIRGIRYVRPATQVDERTIGVRRDHLVRSQIRDALELQRVVRESATRLVARYFLTDKRKCLGHDRVHLALKRRQVVRRERLRDAEVVVEPIFDRRAEPDLGVGAQTTHGRRQDMCAGMSKNVERSRIRGREHAKRATAHAAGS